MGNCMRHESSAVWAGDDWGSIAESSDQVKKKGSCSSTREVKIKMTRKELEDLVAALDTSGLSLEQLLATLVQDRYRFDNRVEHHHRSWRPSLQTVHELD